MFRTVLLLLFFLFHGLDARASEAPAAPQTPEVARLSRAGLLEADLARGMRLVKIGRYVEAGALCAAGVGMATGLAAFILLIDNDVSFSDTLVIGTAYVGVFGGAGAFLAGEELVLYGGVVQRSALVRLHRAKRATAATIGLSLMTLGMAYGLGAIASANANPDRSSLWGIYSVLFMSTGTLWGESALMSTTSRRNAFSLAPALHPSPTGRQTLTVALRRRW